MDSFAVDDDQNKEGGEDNEGQQQPVKKEDDEGGEEEEDEGEGKELESKESKDRKAIMGSNDPRVQDIVRNVTTVFNLFDQNEAGEVDVREVGSIVRALDLFPTEADVNEIIQNVEETAIPGVVKYERFVPYLSKIILDGERFRPHPCDKIKEALTILDYEGKGTFEQSIFRDMMQSDGEPLSNEETDEMFKVALDRETKRVIIDDYAEKLCFP